MNTLADWKVLRTFKNHLSFVFLLTLSPPSLHPLSAYPLSDFLPLNPNCIHSFPPLLPPHPYPSFLFSTFLSDQQGKPLRRNEPNILKFGAATAALRGKGACNVAHFHRLGLSTTGSAFQRGMQRLDNARRKAALHRKTDAYKQRARIQRGKVFQNHAIALSTPESSLYRKDGFNDHTYSKPVSG